MSEQSEFEQSHDGPEGQEPRVVYVERDRGLFASVRRLRQRAGEAGRRWVAESVDAPLPTSWQERVPDAWDSARGRWVIAAVALAVLVVWVLVVVQAMAR